MPDVELRYWPHHKPIPEGWAYHDGLEGTHHGDHACLIVKVAIEICSCGNPDCKQEPINGHYQGSHCKQVTLGCCGDF